MSYAKGLRCRECGREYAHGPTSVCEVCFRPLEVIYDYEAMARVVSRKSIMHGPRTMWRYRDLLPVEGEFVDLGTGFTPLVKAENLGRELGLDELYIKNDTLNPTFSFKDRVVSVAVSKAREFGFTTVACASTGNLACSVAAYAAKARLKAYVFIPADLEQGKIVGAAIYGPSLIAILGNYDEVNKMCAEMAQKYHWAFVNINIRAYYSEGSKTLGYEVAEQLGWRAPDHAIIPAASGSLHSKVWKGLNEFARLGLISKVPTQVHAAQAAGCSPIVNAYQAGSFQVVPVRPNTICKSLAIGNPSEGYYALKTMKESGGTGVAVTDPELAEGMKLLARTEGIFGETAGGVVIGALKRLVASGQIKRHEVTVAYITGAGLKTPEAVADVVQPLTIQPTVKSFEEALAAKGTPLPKS